MNRWIGLATGALVAAACTSATLPSLSHYGRDDSRHFTGGVGIWDLRCQPGDTLVSASCDVEGGTMLENEAKGDNGWICRALPFDLDAGATLTIHLACERQ